MLDPESKCPPLNPAKARLSPRPSMRKPGCTVGWGCEHLQLFGRACCSLRAVFPLLSIPQHLRRLCAPEPELQISWLLADAYPCLHLEFMLGRCRMLLNVCVYYKTVLNVQCSNLVFPLICDKYFPIMAWQREEQSGAGRWDCSLPQQFKPSVFGEAEHLKSSLPLQTQQLQRLSCCA